MSVRATIQLQLTVLETLATDVPDVASPGPTVRHDQFNVGPLTLSATSTPPAQASSGQQYTGTQTLDFTNLLGTNGAVVNGSGMKLQALLITNLAANTGALTVAPGGSNPLQPFGNVTITVPLGATVLVYFGGNGPAIASGTKTLLITPNNSADKFNVEALMG